MKETTSISKAILGSILSDEGAIHIAAPILKPKDFTGSEAAIYEACLAIFQAGGIPDIVTVTEHLHKRGQLQNVGGAYVVSTLTNFAVFSGNLEKHCLILKEQSFKNQAIHLLASLQNQAAEPTSSGLDLLETLRNKASELLDGIESTEIKTLFDFEQSALAQMREALKGKRSSVPVRNPDLQRLSGGLKNQRLIVVAARPGVGKTALALDLALYASEQSRPVLFFSQEMSGDELGERALSQASDINSMKLSNHAVTDTELTYLESIADHRNLPLYIDPTPGLTLNQIRSRSKKMKRQKGIALIIVDYLQLCEAESEGKNREQEISRVSRGLKKLAKELDVPVVALSQLNRKTEDRADNKPRLGDLRESGAIEQDADTVILMHRPQLYGATEYQLANDTFPAEDLLVLIVAKNRGGILGEIPCSWHGSTMKIKTYEYGSNF